MLYAYTKQRYTSSRGNVLFNSAALTKLHSIILIVVIVFASIGAVSIFVLWDEKKPSSETIKIGVCADLDNIVGTAIWQGARLAAEQVNAEGGVLGRKFEIVAEDDDSESLVDPIIFTNAFTKLITIDNADFVVANFIGFSYREIAVEHKKIIFTVNDITENLTQGVLDNYDRYKYYFRAGWGNMTSAIEGTIKSIVACREYTGFNKIAFIYLSGLEFFLSPIIEALIEYGFDVVLSESVPWESLDYSSSFAKAEAAGAEILYPMILGDNGIAFIKEYYERQSPMIMWGKVEIAETVDFWQMTQGKCEYICNYGYPVVAGYPLTTKTLPTREAYIERWGEGIISHAAAAYDTVRFILPDSIKRAGTIETEAVIKALEETDIETSSARHFVFTPSHDVMTKIEVGSNRPNEDGMIVIIFQWQNGELVPICPKEFMEEAGASFIFPDWSGPWDNIG